MIALKSAIFCLLADKRRRPTRRRRQGEQSQAPRATNNPECCYQEPGPPLPSHAMRHVASLAPFGDPYTGGGVSTGTRSTARPPGRADRAGVVARMSVEAVPVAAPTEPADRPHRWRALHAYIDVAVVVIVLVGTNLIAHFTTAWASIATVPIAAVVLVALTRRRGLGWTELGLSPRHW